MGPGTASASPAASEKAAENIISENISELAEDIIHVHAASAIKASPSVTGCRMAKTIVLRPLVTVT